MCSVSFHLRVPRRGSNCRPRCRLPQVFFPAKLGRSKTHWIALLPENGVTTGGYAGIHNSMYFPKHSVLFDSLELTTREVFCCTLFAETQSGQPAMSQISNGVCVLINVASWLKNGCLGNISRTDSPCWPWFLICPSQIPRSTAGILSGLSRGSQKQYMGFQLPLIF